MTSVIAPGSAGTTGQTTACVCRARSDEFLKCGRLEHGFFRVRCESCCNEKLVAFSCKRRGFCPSCGARWMVESAALLVDELFPQRPVRQWVLSVPFPLRFLFANHPAIMGQVLRIVYRAISASLCHQAGFRCAEAQTGAVTLIERFGSALNLNPNAARSERGPPFPHAVSGGCLHSVG